MRVESTHPMRNGGWWHRHEFATTHFVPPTRKKTVVHGQVPDFDSILHNADHARLEWLSLVLHVTVQSLSDLGTVYLSMYHAYGFPMYHPNGKVIGIRLRNKDGEKWAVKGSHAGLFIPFNAIGRLSTNDLFICEGPTDTAAALSIDLFAIGRHACSGQEEMVDQVIKNTGAKNIYIICDNDPLKKMGTAMVRPGLLGSRKLAQYIKRKARTILLPTKDLREFVSLGGSRELFFSMIHEVQDVV
jgi:hypothetical protein